MQPRTKNPATIIPEVGQAIGALVAALRSAGLPEATANLVHLRASQINGCSACLEGGARTAQKAGESTERLFSVAAWREAPYSRRLSALLWRSPRRLLALVTAPTRCPTRCGRRRPSTTPSGNSPHWSSGSRPRTSSIA